MLTFFSGKNGLYFTPIFADSICASVAGLSSLYSATMLCSAHLQEAHYELRTPADALATVTRTKKNRSDQHAGAGGMAEKRGSAYRTRVMDSSTAKIHSCRASPVWRLDEDAITRLAQMKCPAAATCRLQRRTVLVHFGRVRAEHEWRGSSRAWPRAERVSLPPWRFHPRTQSERRFDFFSTSRSAARASPASAPPSPDPFVPLLLTFLVDSFSVSHLHLIRTLPHTTHTHP